MTRFIHDQFAKDYLEAMLSPYGTVQAPRRVAGEARQIDVWFAPAPQSAGTPETLGLLGRFMATPCLFEPFRNPVTPEQVCGCLSKLLQVQEEYYREENRTKTSSRQESALPRLWILTPTASENLLSGFAAIIDKSWMPGVYFMADYLRTAIVVIHQLPRTPDTLWLRVLGKGTVQKQTVDELEALPPNNSLGLNALTLLKSFFKNLGPLESLDQEDREVFVRLKELYDRDMERATRAGREQGQRQVIENLLRVRFGELDEQLSAVIDPLLALPAEEFTPILLQLSSLSREELLARFA
ncbi:MAG: hypothetical protein KME26_32165 [Oscillatoria princeps RMCB-10]|jgi:hypothetical protein|nr:hypothetical protein [Oscillatoria princeps RMCB-10]